ncbi:MAG: hypothetical protein JWN94_3795 [Betaproteobacteria bacterium]|nr:hypothetical protein [Betaproteobacteria bacterium]
MNVFANDFAGATASVLLLIAYHVFLRIKLRSDPLYTIQAVNALSRAAWVETVMTAGNKDVLAVQTLRNSIMGATFLSSTAVLLIIGVLTLSGQSEHLGTTWQSLNVFGAMRAELWLAKLLALLLDMLVAFFSFAQAIRLFHHVGYMINVPVSTQHRAFTPPHVALHLNRAGAFYAVGMRAYYIAVPLVFWLFGPHFMLLSTVILLPVLFFLDRAPTGLADDFR